MKHKTFDGIETDDINEVVESYHSRGDIINKALGWSLYSYCPGMVFYRRKNFVDRIELSEDVVSDIIKLIQKMEGSDED